jgi:hypothetical protein
VAPETILFPDTFRERARSGDNPQGRRLWMKEIAKATDSSYEHIRKIFGEGEPVLSKELNEKLCKLLGVPSEDMWREIERHKMKRRYPHAAAGLAGSSDADSRPSQAKQKHERTSSPITAKLWCRPTTSWTPPSRSGDHALNAFTSAPSDGCGWTRWGNRRSATLASSTRPSTRIRTAGPFADANGQADPSADAWIDRFAGRRDLQSALQ